MGGFKSAQVGFRSPWAGMGPLVLMGVRGFARHGSPRVLGLVVVAKNGSVLVYYYYYLGLLVWIWQWWMLMVVVVVAMVVDVDGGSGGGNGGGWFGFWI